MEKNAAGKENKSRISESQTKNQEALESHLYLFI